MNAMVDDLQPECGVASTLTQTSPPKPGRPNQWTSKRSRKAAGLYLCTDLPTQDLAKALQDDDWVPKLSSVNKTVNSLLGHDPRSLRPKTKEEMEQRIRMLSETTKRRNTRRAAASASDNRGCDEILEGRHDVALNDVTDYFVLDRTVTVSDKPVYTQSFPMGRLGNVITVQGIAGHILPNAVREPRHWDEFDEDESEMETSANLYYSRPASIAHASLSTIYSTNSLRSRLSRYSSTYLRQIKRVIKAHSTSGSSVSTRRLARLTQAKADDGISHSPCTLLVEDIPISIEQKTIAESVSFPDAFLLLDHYIESQGICLPGLKRHDTGSCWCPVAMELFHRQICVWTGWKLTWGETQVSRRNWSEKDSLCDAFGNSVLHLLAAQGATSDDILDLVGGGADANATNVAGQTFIHVMHRGTVDSLARNTGLLFQFLTSLEKSGFAFNHSDFFGRTFFHIISQAAWNVSYNSLWSLQLSKTPVTIKRDAFGLVPSINLNFEGEIDDWQRSAHRVILGSSTLRLRTQYGALRDFFRGGIYWRDSHFTNDGRGKLWQLTAVQLLNLTSYVYDELALREGWAMTASHKEMYDHPIQSENGTQSASFFSISPLPSVDDLLDVLERRFLGLESGHVIGSPAINDESVRITHLSPTLLDLEEDAAKIPASTGIEAIQIHIELLQLATAALTHPKVEDKMGRNGLQALAEVPLSLSVLEDSSITAELACKRKRGQNQPTTISALSCRSEYVRGLIEAGVALNHYDMRGNTVLISFITHVEDTEEEKSLPNLFEYLIEKGANVHWRNRQGETALHVAVRLGRKTATKVLLKRGANVHARNPDGKGVLSLGEAIKNKVRSNQKLYASILACMTLAIKYGAVANPTLVQEWLFRS